MGVRRLILHVVGSGTFVAQEEMTPGNHAPFFLDRIRDAAKDGVHAFDPDSETKTKLERMAQGILPFQEGGQELSRAFANAHVKSSSDGAFFVFELETGQPDTIFYSLIKYDYRSVLELTEENGRHSLREIVQAFVTEPKAIQKSCLVRVVNGRVTEPISAFDRMERPPELTDYFAAFLDVKRVRSDQDLTNDLNEVLRLTLSACRDLVPDNDVPAALEVSKASLRGRQFVDEGSVRDAILIACGRPDDEAVRAQIDRTVTKELARKKLTGIEFRPDLSIISQRPRRRIKTAERVVLDYPGEEENRSVKRDKGSGGSLIITITTKAELLEDVILNPKTRQFA